MLRIETKNARPGMSLALPIQMPDTPSRTLLRTGYRLTPETLRKLIALRVRTLWVGYPGLAFLNKVVNQQTIQGQHNVAGQITKTFSQVQQLATAKLPYHQYTKSIESLVSQLINNPNSAVFLGDLAEGGEDLMRHSSTVTYLALLMGLKLEGYLVRERRHVDPARAAEVVNLGIGAMLHDIGVTLLPEAVQQQYEQTGDQDNPLWREHTCLGYRFVRGKVSATIASTVLHHHQHFDGSGYAGADFGVMHGKRIHVFSRIVTVADQFDRMRHPVNLPAQPTVWALRNMLQPPLMYRYDPHVLDALLSVVPPYAPGTLVRLSDDRHAVVVDHNPHRPCRPVVQIIDDPEKLKTGDIHLGSMVNLAEHSPGLMVNQSEGFHVGEFNFERPSYVPRSHETMALMSA